MQELADRSSPKSALQELCLSCGGPTHAWIDMPVDAMRRMPTDFGRTVRCESCGLGSISPKPARHHIATFYDIPAYYTHGAEQPAMKPGLFDRAVMKLAWWRDNGEQLDPASLALELPAGAKICDLGCGQAEHLLTFKKLGFEVVGVDPDPAARRAAGRLGIDVLDGTADEPPPALKAAEFDLVLMTHALEHCLDPVAALATSARILKPGGLFYCEVPNCACRHFAELRECSTMFDAPRHLHFFSPETLRAMLRKAGFRPVKELFSGFSRQHSLDWRSREIDIARQLRDHDPRRRGRLHSRSYTISLFGRTAFAAAEAKYDSFGVLARR